MCCCHVKETHETDIYTPEAASFVIPNIIGNQFMLWSLI